MAEEILNAQEQEQELSEILQVRRDKLKALQDEGRDPFNNTKFERTAYSADVKDNFETMENQTVSMCGRIMAKRGMGKAIFADIADDKGRIQIYVRLNDVGAETFADFRKVDIGDIIGIEGFVFKTKMGEISVHCHKVVLLSKSLRPLPEKFHGLTDLETRYRQRYVDLIMNPEVKDTFVKRSLILRELRSFLDGKGFLEVDTPILTPFEIGASARPFITHHNTLDMDMVLRIETEL